MKASSTLARTQPLVVMPVTITVSVPPWIRYDVSGVPKNPLGFPPL